MPSAPLSRYRKVHQALRAGLIAACHDLSEGGLAVAVAEMCLGGRLGARLDLGQMTAAAAGSGEWLAALFGESNGRLLLEVRPEAASDFVAALAGETCVLLGEVTATGRLSI